MTGDVVTPQPTFGTVGAITSLLDQAITRDFIALDQGGKIIATYCWIDGTGSVVRSKARTLPGPVKSIDDLPIWNYDGSSTYQVRAPLSFFR